ncbi:MAG: flagellar cap protein FliD N-terminal domain-containing protein, partial [Firmicutes bacterium]|nr:flagellar cap protein FliD N-terminal domain-containing protein [Bacillota bacterium]
MAGDFRISGLASGYDTAQLVEQLIAIERRPVLQMQKRQDRIKARSDAWRDITTRLSNLKSRISSLKLAGTMNAKSASSSDDKLLTATAEPGAANSVYKIWVDQLATSTKVISGGQVGRELDLDVKLSDAGFAITPTLGTFTINGVAIRIDADTVMSDGVDGSDSNSILGKINSSGTGVTASVEGNRLVLRAQPDAGPIRLGSGGDTSNFLTAAKVLGVPASDTIASYGALGVAKT